MLSSLEQTSKYVRSIVFSFLRVKDITALLFVNKRLRNFALEFFAEYKEIKIKEYDLLRLSHLLDLRRVLSYFPKIATLRINAYNLSVDNFESLPRTLVKLALLNCKESLLLQRRLYENIQNRVGATLKDLRIEYHDSDSTEPVQAPPKDFLLCLEDFAKNMKVLKKLDFKIVFKGWHPYDMHTLNNIVFYCFHQNSESLTSVHFNYLIVHPFVPKPNKNIKSIKIEASEGYFFDDNNAPVIFGLNNSTIIFLANQFRDLEEISVTDHTNYKKALSDSVMNSLVGRHPNIRCLCLNSYSYKLDMNETSILQTITALPSLEKFGLASCKNLCLSSMFSLSLSLHNVKYLTLDFTDVDDNDLQIITELLEQLEFISTKCCYQITEEGFIHLCQHLFKLKAGNFKYVKSFTSVCLENLLFYSPNLQKIKLGNNTLTNEDINHLFTKGSRLKEITLSSMNGSDQFSQECFSHLNCSHITLWRLKALDLSNNHLLKDISIFHLLQLELPSLSYLSLEGCIKLTKKAFEYIGHSKIAQNLFGLNFYIKEVVIDKDLFSEVKKKMKRLAYLFLYNCSTHRSLKYIYEDIDITLLEQ